MSNLKQKRFVDTDYFHEQLDSTTVEVEGSHISATETKIGYLKDIEILGNTVQDASNLADIRSVGDKVEGQELYEIPIVSCGKNLLNKKTLKEMLHTYIQDEDGSKIKLNYVSMTSNRFEVPLSLVGNYTISYQCKETVGGKNPKLGFRYSDGSSSYDISFVTTSNYSTYNHFSNGKDVVGLCITYNNTGGDFWVDLDSIQLEEGTVATPYEPYQEDKLTILSPVQLEKVGDVADRIIEKDGVWGVEKNVIASVDENNVLINTKNKSEFIPLPHSQQIKLRTFANKTNISFLTEIEGTLVAQVPKSLGATVNTHTEQINNLNKELDRVKKLEESTVSTVETESDFTTVEATSNGYFEDVKLEGKTLVNIHPKATPVFTVSDGNNPKYNVTKKEGYIKVTGSDLEATSYRYVNMGRINFEMFKPNTTYTVIFTKFRGLSRITIQNGNSQHPIVKGGSFNTQDNKLVYTFVTTETLVKSEQILYLWIDPKSTTIDVEAENPMIFEGDLTANPPSGYIEGLKSVGQSATTSEDGADEVSVESVNENLFDGDKELFVSSTQTWEYFGTPIPTHKVEDGFYFSYELKSNTSFTTSSSHSCVRVEFYTSNGSVGNIGQSSSVIDVTTEYKRFEYYIPNVNADKAKLIRFVVRNSDGKNLYIRNVKISTVNNNYTPHQSDKKRLLYYNNETQTWEKPILRQWDSIEKHADGKYYYHQRSGAKVLNGSENWNNDKNSSTISPETYRQSIQFDAIDIPSASFNTKTSPNIISDLLPTVIFGDVYSHNHIGISISGTGSVGTHIIINNNFTDVTELKQWLQANNVTVVYQLAEEKVYECTNIDLITYANETNYIVNSGVIVPKTTLKVHNNISNVVSLLQKKVSLLEAELYNYKVNQNLRQLRTSYRSDYANFGVATLNNYSVEPTSIAITPYGYDLFEIFKEVIAQGKDKYDRIELEEYIDFYLMTFVFDFDMVFELFDLLDANEDIIEDEPVEEEPPTEEEEDVVEDTPTILPNLQGDEATPIPLI